MDHMANFARQQDIKGCSVHPLSEGERTPFLIVTVEASEGYKGENCVLMYGHMDKQPFGEGWKHDPCDPVIENGKMNGRGSSDDGYSFYSALLAIKACQVNGLSHPRVVVTIEANEEGGTEEDLIHYMSTYKSTLIGEPNVVFCLDSDAFSEDTLVISSSLRGCVIFDLKVTAFKENLHSGYSGIVPDPHHIGISLISRIFDFSNQTMIQDFHVEIPIKLHFIFIPPHRIHECKLAADKLPSMLKMLPVNDSLKSIAHDQGELEKYHLIANSTWLPQLTITGLEGLPNNLADASNSIKRQITFRCSMRLPPTLTAEKAKALLQKHLIDHPNQQTP